MTTKRFTVFGEWHKDNIIDEIRDNGDTLSIGEVVELLNELHDKYIDEYALRETLQQELQRVEKENEQLKKDIEYYKTERLALFEYLDKKDDLKLGLKVEK